MGIFQTSRGFFALSSQQKTQEGLHENAVETGKLPRCPPTTSQSRTWNYAHSLEICSDHQTVANQVDIARLNRCLPVSRARKRLSTFADEPAAFVADCCMLLVARRLMPL